MRSSSWLLRVLQEPDFADTDGHPVPTMALLAGNPKDPSRRYIVMSFDSEHERRVVAKVGVGDLPAALVEQRRFLSETAGLCGNTPGVRSHAREKDFAALSASYMGSLPADDTEPERVFQCICPWIDNGRRIRLGDSSLWPVLTARKLLSRPVVPPAAGGPGLEGVKGEEGGKWFILRNFSLNWPFCQGWCGFQVGFGLPEGGIFLTAGHTGAFPAYSGAKAGG